MGEPPSGMSLKVPQQADIGYRSPNALIGSGANVVIPGASTGSVEFEGELVAVVGKQAKHLSEREALECIAGHTLGNDLSERDWQRGDRTLWRAKNADTFTPMDPPWSRISIHGTDDRRSDQWPHLSEYSTANMILGLQHFIARMTRYVTLHPGDVIWLGCDGPTLPALQPGDLVEVVNEAIGVLWNRRARSLTEAVRVVARAWIGVTATRALVRSATALATMPEMHPVASSRVDEMAALAELLAAVRVKCSTETFVPAYEAQKGVKAPSSEVTRMTSRPRDGSEGRRSRGG